MATTQTSICNGALIKLGAQRILSIDEDSERARVLKEQYPKVRDELLYGHPWNFATKRVELAPLLLKPIYEWAEQFQLPLDYLRVYGVDPITLDFKVEGSVILANVESLKIKYIARIEDCSLYSPAFVQVLETRLAMEACYLVTQSSPLKETLKNEYIMRLREARSFDAQESQGDRVYADSWLNSRA